MKCVIEKSIRNEVIVFETSKITYISKREIYYPNNLTEYVIDIYFDNGKSESLCFRKIEERNREWDRIMKCWRDDEISFGNGPLTAAN